MSKTAKVLCLAVALAWSGCASEVTDDFDTTASAGPDTGAADRGDFADHNCRVTLSSVQELAPASGARRFDVYAEVDASVVNRARVGLLYRAWTPEPQGWFEIRLSNVPSGGTRPLFQGVVQATGLVPRVDGHTKLELIPFVVTPDNERYFDHNVASGNYVVTASTGPRGWGYAKADAVCAVAPAATIHFTEGFDTRVEGTIRSGELVAIDYAVARLPQCRGTYNGYETWSIFGAVVPHPSRQVTFQPMNDGKWLYRVPVSATSLELWFFNTGRGCDQTYYDSHFGENYSFDVAR